MIGLALGLVSAVEQEGPLLDAEEERLLAAQGSGRPDGALRFRCARRAVATALGLGPRKAAAVRVCATDAGLGRLTVAAGEERWLAQVARDGDVVVAWTLGERGQ
jgi:hypothetical protein